MSVEPVNKDNAIQFRSVFLEPDTTRCCSAYSTIASLGPGSCQILIPVGPIEVWVGAGAVACFFPKQPHFSRPIGIQSCPFEDG
jgi:hypothetical protein